MLAWILFFFIVSVIAGWFGFTGTAKASAGIAKVLFFIFLVMFIILLIFGVLIL